MVTKKLYNIYTFILKKIVEKIEKIKKAAILSIYGNNGGRYFVIMY